MSIVKGGTTTIASLGEFQLVPGQVSMTVANDGDGDAFTATLAGDTGAQNYLMYREFFLDTSTDWTAGGNRAGDGVVQVTGLNNNTWYEAYAYSVQEGSYGLASPVVRFKVTDGGTLATETLATNYWKDKRQYHVRTLQADTWERRYKVQLRAWESLKPAVGDEYYDDANQIVARVEQRPVAGASDTAWMVVTYIEISNKGWTSDYAETRRVTGDQYHETAVTVYGIAKAIDSAGIPATAAALDGGTGTFDPICNDVQKDDQMYPGLWVITSKYGGSLAYT